MANFRLSILLGFLIICSLPAQAHLGPHESKDCFIDFEEFRLRFNGYQFHGPHPDKHYCRYFPELGDIIIKIDALQTLDHQVIALEWLEMNTLGEIMAGQPLLRSTLYIPWKPFANNLHSLRNNVTKRGVYGLTVKLKNQNGAIRQRHHYFLAGIPVMRILLSAAGLLLLLIVFAIFRRLGRR